MEVYKVAVHLGMTSNAPSFLSALSSQLMGVHAKVKDLEGGFKRLHLAIGGGLAILAGTSIIRGLEHVVDKTKDLSSELVRLERLGGNIGKAAASGELTKRAFDISQRVPMNVVDLLKIPGATYSIIGEKESLKIWEQLAQFGTVLKSQKDFHGDVGTELQKILRAGELSGRISDPVTHQASVPMLRHFLDLASRVIAATHGMVNPDTLLGMAKQGGFTLRGLTDQGFYTQAILAQAMGGPRAGTATMSMWQQMAGGVMFTRTAEAMQHYGLLHEGEWKKDHGRVILNDAASKRLTAMIGKDPLDFAKNVIDVLKKNGVTDPQDQMRAVLRIMNRQTTQRMTAEMVTNFFQMLAERGRMENGMGEQQSFKTIMNKDVAANMEALHKAWDNLLFAVAGPNSENVIKVLQSLTGAINSITASVNGMNPETVRKFAAGLAALAVVLVGGGAVALLAAIGPAGWFVLGIGGLVAAITRMDKKTLSEIAHDLAAIGRAAAACVAPLKWLADAIGAIAHLLPGGNGKAPAGGYMIPGAEGMPTLPSIKSPGKQGYYSPSGLKYGMNDNHTHVYLDGEKVGMAVTRRQVASAQFPNAIGGVDTYGSWTSPGTGLIDAA